MKNIFLNKFALIPIACLIFVVYFAIKTDKKDSAVIIPLDKPSLPNIVEINAQPPPPTTDQPTTISQLPSTNPPSSINTIHSKNKLINVTLNCYINLFKSWQGSSGANWMYINEEVEKCVGELKNAIPYIQSMPHYYEHKYYVLPIAEHINDPCSVVTFGIGNEVASELHIKTAMPQCTFIGFDPNPDYEKLFTESTNGTFVKATVGGKTGTLPVFQLGSNGYEKKSSVPVTAVSELIETYHGKDKLIDILNIDIEGGEHGVFEQLTIDKVYQNVCQINVEIHPVWFHNTGYTYHDLINSFLKIAEDGTFVWFHSDTFMKQHYPSFFINVKNKMCIEKYLKSRVF